MKMILYYSRCYDNINIDDNDNHYRRINITLIIKLRGGEIIIILTLC